MIEESEIENVERLKGKQVQFLYDLVTVIREYSFDDLSLMQNALGRQKLYEDLSARKPASCLVPG